MAIDLLPDAVSRIAELTSKYPRVVLAVSGGLDSVCLTHLVHRHAKVDCRVHVAVFDHMSGPHSGRSVEFVTGLAKELGLQAHVGRAGTPSRSEAEWREGRWRFLRSVAREYDSIVVTAHTRDDHLETVVMRIMRGGGARGLAGLLAKSRDVARPLIQTTRAQLANYAKLQSLSWVEDPTNLSLAFFRNRVRLEILPALVKVDPSFADEMLLLSARAAELRSDLESLVAPWISRVGATLMVSREVLTVGDPRVRAELWPALLGPNQVILDRRGIDRLAQLDLGTRRGTRVPLSGNWEATVLEEGIRVMRPVLPTPSGVWMLPESGELTLGNWRFAVVPVARDGGPEDEWSALLPAGVPLTVRAWQQGDRIASVTPGPEGESAAPRRVKRFFADQKVPANDREGWPVVLSNDEIIWIPGIRRAKAASVRSGRPLRLVVCERIEH